MLLGDLTFVLPPIFARSILHALASRSHLFLLFQALLLRCRWSM